VTEHVSHIAARRRTGGQRGNLRNFLKNHIAPLDFFIFHVKIGKMEGKTCRFVRFPVRPFFLQYRLGTSKFGGRFDIKMGSFFAKYNAR
jgi:hypothetical protein